MMTKISHPAFPHPLRSLLRSGMKLTIAFDDISLPLPPMASPDVRKLVIEEVIDLAAHAGVEDIELIAAIGLHRKMTADEIRHIVGDRIFSTFWPDRLYQHDGEDRRRDQTNRVQVLEVVLLRGDGDTDDDVDEADKARSEHGDFMPRFRPDETRARRAGSRPRRSRRRTRRRRRS